MGIEITKNGIINAPIRYVFDDLPKVQKMKCALNKRILFYQDSSQIANALLDALKRVGYQVVFARGADHLLHLLNFAQYELLVIEWSNQNFDGLSTLHFVKTENKPNLLILMYTDRVSEFDIVSAFNAGADEVYRSTYGEFEILARINALMRWVTPLSHRVNFENNNIIQYANEKFSKLEIKLFDLFVSNLEACLSREVIREKVWGNQSIGDKAIDVAISRLRKKIKILYVEKYKIISMYNFGYKLVKFNSLNEVV